jgi:hypothetical protein
MRNSESRAAAEQRVFDLFKTRNGSRLFMDRQARGALKAEEIRDRRIALLTPQDVRDGFSYEIAPSDTPAPLRQKDNGKARGGTGR